MNRFILFIAGLLFAGTLYSQPVRSMTIIKEDSLHIIADVGVTQQAVPGQWYLATDVDQYFFGAQDQTLIGPIATGVIITDDQTIDTFRLVGTSLEISLEDDGEPIKSVDLSSLQDGTGTDDQQVDVFQLANDLLRLSLESDGQATHEVDLSLRFPNRTELADTAAAIRLSIPAGGTDDQTIDTFRLVGTTLEISLEADAQSKRTADLSSLQDGTGTDDQNITGSSWNFSNGELTIGIENGSNQVVDIDGRYLISEVDGDISNELQDLDILNLNGTVLEISLTQDPTLNTVDLASLQDGTGTDDQTVDVFQLSNDLLRLSLESDGQATHEVDLSLRFPNRTELADTAAAIRLSIPAGGTDDQKIDTFRLVGTTLEISLEADAQAKRTVELSSLQDGTGTDDQNITGSSFNTGNGEFTIGIENGSSQVVDIDGRYLTAEVDGDASNELQDLDILNLNGTVLEISLTQDPTLNTVDLASLQDGTGTDDQTVDVFQLSNDLLRLSLESDGQATHELDLSLRFPNRTELADTAANIRASFPAGSSDDQTIDTFRLVGTTLEISLESDAQAKKSVDLSSLQDGTGTDDQNITGSSWNFSNGELTIGIENGSSQVVDIDGRYLISEVDGDISNELQDLDILNLNGTVLEISLTQDPTLNTVNLSSLQDGTGTDDQNITGSSFNTGNGEFTIGIENGSSQVVDIDGRYLTAEVDGSVSNELQDLDILNLNGTTLEISLTQDPTLNTVNLSSLQDGYAPDDQYIDLLQFSGGNLEISLHNDGLSPMLLSMADYATLSALQDTAADLRADLGGGGGTPGGSNTQVQYNNNGSFAGDADLTFDGDTLELEHIKLQEDLILYDGQDPKFSMYNSGVNTFFDIDDATGSLYIRDASNSSIVRVDEDDHEVLILQGLLHVISGTPQNDMRLFGDSLVFDAGANTFALSAADDNWLEFWRNNVRAMSIDTDGDIRVDNYCHIGVHLGVGGPPSGVIELMVRATGTTNSTKGYQHVDGSSVEVMGVADGGRVTGKVIEWINPLVAGEYPRTWLWDEYVADPWMNNILFAGDKRLGISATNTSSTNYFHWFDGRYDAGVSNCNLTAGTTAVITIDFDAKGLMPFIVYPQGKVKIHTYAGHDIDIGTASARWQDNLGAWTSLTNNGEVATTGSGQVYEFEITGGNYMEVLEITLPNSEASDVWLTAVEYFPERLPGVDVVNVMKYGAESLFDDWTWYDDNGTSMLYIGPFEDDILQVEGNVRFGATNSLHYDHAINSLHIGGAGGVYTLDINSTSSNVALFKTSNPINNINFQNSTDTWTMQLTSTGLKFVHGGTTHMVMSDNGNNGWGTTTPAYDNQFVNDLAISGPLRDKNGSIGLLDQIPKNDGTGRIVWSTDETAAGGGDGYATSGTYDAVNNEIDIDMTDATDFSIDLDNVAAPLCILKLINSSANVDWSTSTWTSLAADIDDIEFNHGVGNDTFAVASGVITVPYDGIYKIVRMENHASTSSTKECEIQMRKNGSTMIGMPMIRRVSSTVATRNGLSTYVQLDADDTIEPMAHVWTGTTSGTLKLEAATGAAELIIELVKRL